MRLRKPRDTCQTREQTWSSTSLLANMPLAWHWIMTHLGVSHQLSGIIWDKPAADQTIAAGRLFKNQRCLICAAEVRPSRLHQHIISLIHIETHLTWNSSTPDQHPELEPSKPKSKHSFEKRKICKIHLFSHLSSFQISCVSTFTRAFSICVPASRLHCVDRVRYS